MLQLLRLSNAAVNNTVKILLVAVKTKAARLLPFLKNGPTVPLVTALKTATAPDSVKIRRYVLEQTFSQLL